MNESTEYVLSDAVKFWPFTADMHAFELCERYLLDGRKQYRHKMYTFSLE